MAVFFKKSLQGQILNCQTNGKPKGKPKIQPNKGGAVLRLGNKTRIRTPIQYWKDKGG